MKTYMNKIEINGVTYTHIIKASNYKEALTILRKRKIKAKREGRIIKGRLYRHE